MDSVSSARRLAISTAIAACVAAIMLLSFVLPAEYGIDPTGAGHWLGLQQMHGIGAEDDLNAARNAIDAERLPDSPVSVFDALWKRTAPFRSDELSLTLQPDQGAEIKANMQTGDRFVFAWQVDNGAQVSFDMHGEAFGAATDDFTSYLKGRNAATGDGAFVAPFAGNHGWYWRNRNPQPVTIRVRTSGFYQEIRRL